MAAMWKVAWTGQTKSPSINWNPIWKTIDFPPPKIWWTSIYLNMKYKNMSTDSSPSVTGWRLTLPYHGDSESRWHIKNYNPYLDFSRRGNTTTPSISSNWYKAPPSISKSTLTSTTIWMICIRNTGASYSDGYGPWCSTWRNTWFYIWQWENCRKKLEWPRSNCIWNRNHFQGKGVTPIMRVDRADGKTTASSLQIMSTTGKAWDKAQDIHLLWWADMVKYTPLMNDLKNDFLRRKENYPTTVLEAYSLLLHYKSKSAMYSRNIKDVYAYSFSMDGAIEDKKKKPPYIGRKGENTQEGENWRSTGGDIYRGNTAKTEDPHFLIVWSFCCRKLVHYSRYFSNKKKMAAPEDNYNKAEIASKASWIWW